MTPLPQYAGTAKGGGAGIGGGGAPVVGRQPDLKQRDRMQRALARVQVSKQQAAAVHEEALVARRSSLVVGYCTGALSCVLTSRLPHRRPTKPTHPHQRFCIKHALPLGFLVGLIWALTWPEPGQATAEIVVGKTASNPKGLRLIEFLNNVNVFLVSGLTLRTDDFRHLARHWTAPAYGAIGILLITPLLALLAKVQRGGNRIIEMIRSVQSPRHRTTTQMHTPPPPKKQPIRCCPSSPPSSRRASPSSPSSPRPSASAWP